MSSENFENLEEDFGTLRDKITRRIENDVSKMYGETRKNVLREIQHNVDEAQLIIVELENESKTAPAPYRIQMNNKIKQYEQELSQVKKKLASMDEFHSPRNALFSRTRHDAEVSVPSSSRSRLLQINQTINRTSERVIHAQQIAAETDEVGVAVIDELGTQRESLVRTKERLVDTDANLTRSRKILLSMYRKVITNKLILILVIVLELAILAGVVYYKFFK